MHTAKKKRGRKTLFVIFLLAFAASAPAQNWKIKDPLKSAQRTMEAATEGDSKKAKEIASHTVGYAIAHYSLKDLISKADIDRATADLYDFMKWEVGSPSAIAAQYTTAGYEHFERRFGDEAAASLLGTDLPGEKGKPEITLPKTVSTIMKALVDSLGNQAVVALQQQYNMPPEVSKEIVSIMTRGGKGAIDRIGFNMPKSWDIDNRLVDEMIYLRRHPPVAHAATAATTLKKGPVLVPVNKR
jgi:hypothetical protein